MNPLTILEVMTLVFLSNSKPLRDAAESADYDRLGPTIEKLKADPKGTLQQVLKDFCGLEWDGTTSLAEAVISEQKRLSGIAMAKKEIQAKMQRLHISLLTLDHPAISGPELLEETVRRVSEE